MRKLYNLLKTNTGSVIFGVICASIGSALFIPTNGFLTTLPFIVLFTAIPTLICKKYYYPPVMFFALTYFFCFAKDVPLKYPEVFGGYALNIAFWALLISAITSLACYLLTKAEKGKKSRAVFTSLSALLVIAATLCTFTVNGTPMDFLNAKNKIGAYAKENFTEGELDIGKTYYNPKGKYYACDAAIVGTVDKGSFVYKNSVTDTFGHHAVNYAGLGKAIEISKILRAAFPTESFTVTPEERNFDGVKISFKDPSTLLPLISYTVTIHSEETAKSFVEKAEAYVAVISNSRINCGNITVIGGAKQKLYYSLSIDTTAPHKDLGKFLRIYNNCLLPQSSVLNAHNSFQSNNK